MLIASSSLALTSFSDSHSSGRLGSASRAPCGYVVPRSRRHVTTRAVIEGSSPSSNLLAQLAEDVSDAAARALAYSPAVSDAVDAIGAVPDENKSGPFDFLADFFEESIKVMGGGLQALHVPYSYGFSIILITILVKLVTFPLSKKQVESTFTI
eukprot:gene5582-4217_t